MPDSTSSTPPSSPSSLPATSIAIVGMSGRFPGAGDLDAFWRNLEGGVDAIRTLTRDELLEAGVAPRDLDKPGYVGSGGFLDDPDLFDAAFFGFSAREAELMDPQHRLFLEQAWTALEDAGYDSEAYDGAVGVYCGMNLTSYLIHNLLGNPAALEGWSPVEIRIRNDKDFLASWASYKLGLTGPSISIQTACSTSLVAIAQACTALLAHQCDMALAGGVSVKCPTRHGYRSQDALYAPDGRCRAFDAGAEGTVPGDGVGVVVLKRLSDALAEGDAVRAVIRGWAVNNDGGLKVGYTTPSVEGQVEVVAMAQALAGVDPESVTYVEAHGTGTPMGDAVEVAALSQVFRQSTEARGFCALGSVKTGIGHLDAASGVASTIKTVLALEHRVLPASLHWESPNPQIDFEASPFFVNATTRPWEVPGGPRRAGVNAFAVGGVNAHLVLEEAPPAPPPAPSAREHQLLVLSARTAEALDEVTGRLAARLGSDDASDLSLADVAFTLQLGRRPFKHRRILVARDAADAADALERRDPKRLQTGSGTAGHRPIAFLFPGLGNHYPGMAGELYETEEAFREALDACCELFDAELAVVGGNDPSLRTLLLERQEAAPADARLDFAQLVGQRSADGGAGALRPTRLAQPAVFTVGYALARLWTSWGIEPDVMAGYSVGEFVAACLAGVLDLPDAVRLVTRRAAAIDALAGGEMLAVTLPAAEVGEVLDKLGGELSLSAVNGPEICVVSGTPEAVETLEAELSAREVVTRRLETTHAFHSKLMQPAVAEVLEVLRGIELRSPEIPYLSNVTGTWIRDEEATDATFWASHLVGPVLFDGMLEELWKEPGRVLLELGPGQTLGAWALQHPARSAAAHPLALATLPHAADGESHSAFALRALGRLWLAGVEPDWDGFHGAEARCRVSLPTYPFEGRRYWIDPDPEAVRKATRSLDRLPPEDWLWVPSWRELGPAAMTEGEAAREWVVFTDTGGVGDALAAALAKRGHRAVTVRSGKDGDAAHRVEAADVASYESLLEALAGEGLRPGGIVDCRPLDAASSGSGEDGVGEPAAFFHLLALVQALDPTLVESSLELAVLTSGLCDVTGGEALRPELAALLGITRVLPRESPGLRCRVLDLDLGAAGMTPSGAAAACETLLEEPAEEPGLQGDVVALRGRRRWAGAFRPFHAAAGPDASGAPALRDGGTYLLTGGLGGLGSTFARHLAQRHGARLALVGRSPLSDDDPRRAVLNALARAGAAEVVYRAADVTDRAALAAAVKEIHAQLGRIDGVIHAAGAYPSGMLRAKTPEEATAVLAPKLAGTRHLADVLCALPGEPPDFLLLCSSLTTELGTFGLSDHVGANAFLDAFAAARLRDGLPVLSVSWDAWLEVGQAARGVARLREVMAGGPAPAAGPASETADGGHPLLGERRDGDAGEIVFHRRLDADSHWSLAEHRLDGRALLPGTAYLEMARAALDDAEPGRGAIVVEDLWFAQPLVLSAPVETRLVLERRGDAWEMHVESRPVEKGEVPWTEHVRGKVRRAGPGEGVGEGMGTRTDLDALRARLQLLERSDLRTADRLELGPRWQEIEQRVWRDEDEALVELVLAERFTGDLDHTPLHPALLDCATGVVLAMAEELHLPLGYESVVLRGDLPRQVFSHVHRLEDGAAEGSAPAAAGSGLRTADLTILDADGAPCLEIRGYTLRRLAVTAAHPRAEPAAATDLLLAAAEGIRPAEGAELLERLVPLAGRLPRVLVSVRDFEAWLEVQKRLGREQLLDGVDSLLEGRAKHPRPALDVEYAAPRNATETALAEIWEDLLGLETVGIHDDFFEIGGDSLLATQLLLRLRSSFDVEVRLRQLFEARTIADLADRIDTLRWISDGTPDAGGDGAGTGEDHEELVF